MSGLRRWMAFGTGVGIELMPTGLRIAIVRMRPSGADIQATHFIENHHERPAAEWGAEYAKFLSDHGSGHLAAAVLLPRREVTVRVVALPGVAGKDMEAALRLQIDSLHPYPESEAAWTWARIGDTPSLLVAVTRRAYVDRQLELLTEAGIKVASFTFSAAAMYGALRLMGAPPAGGFLGLMDTGAGVEAYGESPAKPVYSATFSEPWERAAVIAGAELRLQEGRPRELVEILPQPRSGFESPFAMAYLAGLNAACPRLALPANLLPLAGRRSSSRWIYVPTLALGTLLALGLAALGFYQRYEDKKYLDLLNREISFLEPKARMLQLLDQRTEKAQARIRMLDSFQARTRTDLDALKEVTKLIAPPAWLNTLELSRNTLVIAGEADQATGLLKALDSSAQFQNSEFLVPLSRMGQTEVFRIRSAREGVSQ